MNIAFMHEAVTLAHDTVVQGAGGPFGAVIVKDGAIIGRGANRVLATNDPTAHAEVLAIRDACQRTGSFHLPGAELYTSCEPCPMCLAAIYWAHLDRVYFALTREDAATLGFVDEELYRELNRPIAHRWLPMEQVACDDALRLLQLWEGKSDRRIY